MKKIYIKPEIMFEDFAMSKNIASGCEIKITTASNDQCGYAYEGGGGSKLFISTVTDCDVQIDDSETNGFCYHVPIEANNLFNS